MPILCEVGWMVIFLLQIWFFLLWADPNTSSLRHNWPDRLFKTKIFYSRLARITS